MKILVLGPTSESNESAWISKVTSLIGKQKFDLILVMGTIPNVQTFIASINIPTYFISDAPCDDTELYLGKNNKFIVRGSWNLEYF